MGFLSTHVLDTYSGQPAEGLSIGLYAVVDGDARPLGEFTTNRDGRCDGALLADDAFCAGVYELRFQVGAYFRAQGLVLDEPPFLDDVPVRFGVSRPEQHYHVPLLVTPWSYSTYRGS